MTYVGMEVCFLCDGNMCWIYVVSPVPIPAVVMDEQGIIPEELEKVLQSHHQSHPPPEPTEKKPFWSMLYCMPTFHNPTGICLSPGELSHTFEVVKGCETFKNDTGLSEGSMVDESVLY